jgi:hypothetical protein
MPLQRDSSFSGRPTNRVRRTAEASNFGLVALTFYKSAGPLSCLGS